MLWLWLALPLLVIPLRATSEVRGTISGGFSIAPLSRPLIMTPEPAPDASFRSFDAVLADVLRGE